MRCVSHMREGMYRAQRVRKGSSQQRKATTFVHEKLIVYHFVRPSHTKSSEKSRKQSPSHPLRPEGFAVIAVRLLPIALLPQNSQRIYDTEDSSHTSGLCPPQRLWVRRGTIQRENKSTFAGSTKQLTTCLRTVLTTTASKQQRPKPKEEAQLVRG